MSRLLDGRVVRDKIRVRLARRVKKLRVKPTLAIIQVGNLAESNLYIKRKIAFAKQIGVTVKHRQYPTSVAVDKLKSEIGKLNRDRNVWGIIVQLPLPAKLDKQKIIKAIAPEKDLDGLKVGSHFTPATARGILTLLKYYKIELKGKRAVVIGRSQLVGKPIAQALLAQDATVTVCHSKTKNLASVTKPADILIVAVGKPKLITAKHVRPGQIIVDVGITVVGRKLVGDVDFRKVAPIVRAISPVPGGVGPLTVASLFQNLLES